LNTNYSERINNFLQALDHKADLAFFPISPDLQFLTGIHRDMPTFGAIRHPGNWVEGLWLTPNAEPILVLTRMTAEFCPPGDFGKIHILGDHDDPYSFLRKILKELGLRNLTRAALGERASGETLINLQIIDPGVVFLSASELLIEQRMVKSDPEISAMKKAGSITEQAFDNVVGSLKHGITELDVILEVDYQLRAHGSLGSSFNTALYVVGPNHELFFNQPFKTLNRTLSPPVSILFDFGAIWDGYCYDFGRTVSFGEPSAGLVLAHQLVMAAQQAGIQAMADGKTSAEQVDETARNIILEAGMGEAFRHRLGHGIGLDVHEPPFLTKGDNTILRTGMLFTVEPSILVPFSGSARVEDVVLVGPNGGIPLTTSYQALIVIDS